MEGEDGMNTQNTSQATDPRYYVPRPPRQRINTADLMCGGRELVLLHEGAEYILRITKTGKLILTK
jgi:hemin uptake protein HemP